MLVALASLVLAIVFAVRGYNKTKDDPNQAEVADNFNKTYMFLASVIGVALLSALLLATGVLSRKSFTGLGYLLLSLLVLALAIGALVYAWLAYANSTNADVRMDALITALALSASFLAGLLSSGNIVTLDTLSNLIPRQGLAGVNSSAALPRLSRADIADFIASTRA